MWLLVFPACALALVLLAASRPDPERKYPGWDETDFIEAPDSRADHPSQGRFLVPKDLPGFDIPFDDEFEQEMLEHMSKPWTQEEVERTRQDLGNDPQIYRRVHEVVEAIERLDSFGMTEENE